MQILVYQSAIFGQTYLFAPTYCC